MTFPEIMAWALWPIVGIFVVFLLTAMRGRTGLRRCARIDQLDRDKTPYLGSLDRIIDSGRTPAEETRPQWTWWLFWAGWGTTFFVYPVLDILYWQTSVVWITDNFILMGMFGLLSIGGLVLHGCNARSHPLDTGKTIAALLVGVVSVGYSARTLYLDYAEPRLVLEGQARNAREKPWGRGQVEYLADISGHTVDATTPVFERLKSQPYVRVEVGRGSNYIFNIEYLNR